MQLEKIPKAMQPRIIESFWTMMRECESKAHDENSPILKLWVEGFYRQWNEMTEDSKEPVWVKIARAEAKAQEEQYANNY